MEAKILNYVDAMRIAELLDTPNIEVSSNYPIEFTVVSIVKNLTSAHYVELLQILFGITPDTINKYSGEVIIRELQNGLIKNDIVSLMKYYKQAKT